MQLYSIGCHVNTIACLQSPNPLITPAITPLQLIHPSIPQPQPHRNSRNKKTAARAHKISRGESATPLSVHPYPLRDDLPNTSTRVVQSDSKRQSEKTRRVASDPIRHRRSSGKRSSSSHA